MPGRSLLGTRKSLAPSGVDFVRQGVSISMKPSSVSFCLAFCVSLWRIWILWLWSGLLRSRYRYCSLSSSLTIAWSSIGKGGVSASENISIRETSTSISPVGMWGFLSFSPLKATVPSTPMTNSDLRVFACRKPFGSLSSEKTSWVMPLLSRRSTNMRLPRSRCLLTQPSMITFFPTSLPRRSPQ